MSAQIVPIVEGQSEVESIPLLVRRVLQESEVPAIPVARPLRVKRTLVVRSGELERAVTQAIRARQNPGGVLVVLDADDDCPVKLSADLLHRCREATHLPVRVVIANRELECWLLGAKESIRGCRGIRASAVSPPDPEAIRGAKERLSENMMDRRRYVEVDDQPAMIATFDIFRARAVCRSFNKFCKDVLWLADQIAAAS